MVTPELLIPRILRNDVRLAATANATQRRSRLRRSRQAMANVPVNGNIHQCGAGGRVYTFTAPEEGQYVFKRSRRRRAPRTHTSPSSLMGRASVGESLSTSQSDFNELQVANVTAGRHTFRARFDNDWCGAGGNPDARTR